MPKKIKRREAKISPLKGRPMLHWVGKQPLGVVRYFPSQLRESVGAKQPPVEPTYDWFSSNGANLIFHGDNKEILSTLLVSGFRGKVDLICIDPPFDSGADYVRKVKLRGLGNGNGNENGNGSKILGESYTVIEQVQYEDIWANDSYLQFMYERLILLRELLSEKGSIYLHCDENKNHQLRFLLDEVFGQENFRREIIWDITVLSGYKTIADNWVRGHDSIYYYTKGKNFIFNKLKQPHRKEYLDRFDKQDENGRWYFEGRGERLYKDEVIERGKSAGDVWYDIMSFQQQPTSSENTQYPTQKPESLLERIIKSSSDEGSIVLDCFCGSGTTAAIAEKLNRRWIVADLNRGAVQTTMKRLQGVLHEKHGDNGNLVEEQPRGFIHYRVNNYDFAKHSEIKRLVILKYGIESQKTDLFFDGRMEGLPVKIVDLNRTLTRLDIQLIRDEMKQNRPNDERDIVVFCNGAESGIQAELEQESRRRPINKIIVRDIQMDGFTTYQSAEAKVSIRKRGKTASVKIQKYISPTILGRMEMDRTVFDEQIDDFRAQIDFVLIDTDYNGEYFNITESDVPERRADIVRGEYELNLPRPGATIAVKIVDMVGEETLCIS